jgi:hypothetical protein
MAKILAITLLTTVLSFSNHYSNAQEAVKARVSPLAIVTMKYEYDYVKVTYNQPHKRGRKIFGELVKYGEVWRTGANEATEITLTGDLIMQQDTLAAGTYSVFSIPNEKEWTVIFNKQLGQWGAYNYHAPADALRITVPTETIEDIVYEPFTITFEQKNETANMWLMWDRTKVAVPLQFID